MTLATQRLKLRAYLKSILVLCFLPALFINASIANAASPGCGGWSVVQSPNPGPSPNQLNGVATVSARDAWAVGFSGTDASGQVVIEHWDGTQWSAVSSPNPSTGMTYSVLNAVTAISANDVWAVGVQGNLSADYTLIEHWNGTQWSIVSSPNAAPLSDQLSSVTAVSANDVWAVGYFENRTANRLIDQTLTEHWNGTQWSIVSSPNPGNTLNALSGVTAISSKDVWAVGYYFTANVGDDVALTEHWNGSSWSVVSSPSPSFNVNLYSVAAVSTRNVWAVGYNNGQTLTEHWNGSQWSVVTSPGAGLASSLSAVTAIAPGDIWAVGDYLNGGYIANTLTEHWNGKRWSVVSSPSPGTFNTGFRGTAASSSNDVWAVGLADNNTLVEHYC